MSKIKSRAFILLIFYRIPTEDDQISHGGMCAITHMYVNMKMTDQVFAKSGISLYCNFKLHMALCNHKETFECIQSPGVFPASRGLSVCLVVRDLC